MLPAACYSMPQQPQHAFPPQMLPPTAVRAAAELPAGPAATAAGLVSTAAEHAKLPAGPPQTVPAIPVTATHAAAELPAPKPTETVPEDTEWVAPAPGSGKNYAKNQALKKKRQEWQKTGVWLPHEDAGDDTRDAKKWKSGGEKESNWRAGQWGRPAGWGSSQSSTWTPGTSSGQGWVDYQGTYPADATAKQTPAAVAAAAAAKALAAVDEVEQAGAHAQAHDSDNWAAFVAAKAKAKG